MPDDAKGDKKPRKSTAGRNLMRWDPLIDQLLLLIADTWCNRMGCPINWNEIGKLLLISPDGPNVSGEAIKQHIVKTIATREAHGLPVPKLDNATKPRRKGIQNDGEIECGMTPVSADSKGADFSNLPSLLSINMSKQVKASHVSAPSAAPAGKNATKISDEAKSNERDGDVELSTKAQAQIKKLNSGNKSIGKRARKIKEPLSDDDSEFDELSPRKTPRKELVRSCKDKKVNYSFDEDAEFDALNEFAKVDGKDVLGSPTRNNGKNRTPEFKSKFVVKQPQGKIRSVKHLV